jgi:hypothetical protein
MKKLINLALTAAMVAGLFGAASADHHEDRVPNQDMAGGTWYYPYIGPTHDDYGGPMMGFRYDEDYSGEVVYMDDYTIIVEADGSGDIMTFGVFPGETRFDPSPAGVRVGSKVEIAADNSNRAKLVHAVPFYKWLAAQSK